jgi:GNAT superfamily N-acetyltransferase
MLPAATVPSGLLNMAWDEQAKQYPKRGAPGVDLYVGVVEVGGITRQSNGEKVGRIRYEVDSLLYRNSKGAVIGILQWFGEGAPVDLQQPGDFNVLVHPRRQRRGIGLALMREADRRWGPLNLQQQMFTPEGRALAEAFLRAASCSDGLRTKEAS